MTHEVRVKLAIGDIFIIAMVCFFALVMMLFPVFADGNAGMVKITTGLDGESFLLPLNEDITREIESADHTLTVEIKAGKVRVLDSSCPDRVCVNSGSISRGGEVIVCAPAAVTVEILSESEDMDYVIG